MELSFFGLQRATALALLLALHVSARAEPPPFFWGAAFSAHQVEGGNDGSDWWDWEHTPGKIANQETTATATNHYNRYHEDFDLAKKLGLQSVRLSVSWSRIEPENGRFDARELAHYRDVVLALHARGLEPVIALQHFVHPRWFHKMGGWTSPDSPAVFARFAARVAQALSPHVRIWITFNEPMVQLTEGYLKGGYPPGIQDFAIATRVFRNLVRAHGLAAQALRAQMPPGPHRLPVSGVGLALNMNAYAPSRAPNTAAGQQDLRAIETLSHLSQWAFLRATQTGELKYEIPSIPALTAGFREASAIPEAAHSLDWVGVNYYSRYIIERDPKNRLGIRWITPQQGLVDPSGLGKLLLATSQQLVDKIPIVVSENGLDDASDKKRPEFIRAHLTSVAQARNQGVDVRGYWYWSLTDNFEWQSGFTPRFGLIDIDYKTQERTIRDSAWGFRQYILSHPDGPQ